MDDTEPGPDPPVDSKKDEPQLEEDYETTWCDIVSIIFLPWND
jgi:hypothetical protein